MALTAGGSKLSKHKSLSNLVIAAVICMAVILSPITASADSASDGLSLFVTPNVTTASLGETITYNYVISSTCNTTISGLALTDDRLGTINLASTSLEPGENITISAAYTVVEADFPGPLSGSASVTGVSASGSTLTASAISTVTLNPLVASIKVIMSADRTSASVGDTVKYTYSIVNTGDTNLSGITLTDSRLGVITLSADNLTAKASVTATAIYIVAASNLPGPLVSSATVAAQTPSGETINNSSAAVSISLNGKAAAIKVKMSADQRAATENETIKYSYMIVYSGQGTLSNIVLTDSRLGVIVLTSDNLSSQSKLTASATYKVLAADFPGPLVSSAKVSAVDASGQAVSAKSGEVSVELIKGQSHRTKWEILKSKGVPGKGIEHAPGLMKYFNHNSNAEDHAGNHGNGNDKGNGDDKDHGNDKDKGKDK
jgi:hypothetical protein